MNYPQCSHNELHNSLYKPSNEASLEHSTEQLVALAGQVRQGKSTLLLTTVLRQKGTLADGCHRRGGEE